MSRYRGDSFVIFIRNVYNEYLEKRLDHRDWEAVDVTMSAEERERIETIKNDPARVGRNEKQSLTDGYAQAMRAQEQTRKWHQEHDIKTFDIDVDKKHE